MSASLVFLRLFFVLLSIVFLTVFMLSSPTGTPMVNTMIGVGLGAIFGLVLIGFDILFRRYNLRSFNITVIGIFVGYLMGQALVLVFNSILDISSIASVLQPQTLELLKISMFLFGIYLGTIMTLRSSDELYISIPFVRFTQEAQKKKDLVVDISVLSDPRILDLVATGVFDHQLVLPRFVVKELYLQAEMGEEQSKARARRCLEIVKKLETLQHLEMHLNDNDFPDVKDLLGKTVRLARLLDANILNADLSRIQTSSIEGIAVINMHVLSNALKPLTQAGETIKIKIQRFGKEARQGVGYLEDGTMVVVNGGGDYIGETIKAIVLSVKHTSSGRMIFCNVDEAESGASSHDDDEDHGRYEDPMDPER